MAEPAFWLERLRKGENDRILVCAGDCHADKGAGWDDPRIIGQSGGGMNAGLAMGEAVGDEETECLNQYFRSRVSFASEGSRA